MQVAAPVILTVRAAVIASGDARDFSAWACGLAQVATGPLHGGAYLRSRTHKDNAIRSQTDEHLFSGNLTWLKNGQAGALTQAYQHERGQKQQKLRAEDDDSTHAALLQAGLR